MSDDTNTETKPKRGRPPRTESDHIVDANNMIPGPPDADPKSPEMMDWIYTYLPNEMARNFYGGRNYIPSP